MPKFKEKARMIVETLGLEWMPIAGRFSDKADERGDKARKLRVCETFDAARREKVVIHGRPNFKAWIDLVAVTADGS
jgi:uncharacterized protein (DUF169 family)